MNIQILIQKQLNTLSGGNNYEDNNYLVIDKPFGVLIYPDNEDNKNTLANYVSYYYQKTNQEVPVRHVHRLDTTTTGVLIYAKNLISYSYLTNLFEKRKIKKEYYAYVVGKVLDDGIIDKKIGRNRHNSSMIVSPTGQSALTIYHVESYHHNNTLLKVEIKTGRTHQIRVHLASIGHPLVGDTLYGDSSNEEMFLRCCHIGFMDCFKNSWVDFYLPLEKEF